MPQTALTLLIILPLLAANCVAQEHVILLHGLCRTKRSMASMEMALVHAGYRVANIDYPSRSSAIAELGESVVGKAVAACRRDGTTTIHFVTHSLGGILVRSYLARHSLPELGRVVMLGPPNQGSEVVDRLGRTRLFRRINGPAGRELGTGCESTPYKLGPVNFCLGVIAGDRLINWINSHFIPGRDDGKVSVERTKITGMTDHIVLHTAHPFIPGNRQVISQTMQFLRAGAFDHSCSKIKL